MEKRTVVGGVVKITELKQSENGSQYLFLTLAKNYSKKVGETWEEVGTSFIPVTVNGNTAVKLAESNIALGDRLIVSGHVFGRVRPAYNEYPETFEEYIIAEEVGILIGYGQSVDGVIRGKANKEGSQKTKTAKPQAPKTPKKQEAKKVDDFEETPDDFFNDTDDFDDIAF